MFLQHTVEQDRAPAVLPYHAELARQSAGSHQVIIQLIAATTTKAGLKVRAEIDPNPYPAGIIVKDAELAAVNLSRHRFHGEWNYTIAPKTLSLEQ
jgi:hypothetical protein